MTDPAGPAPDPQERLQRITSDTERCIRLRATIVSLYADDAKWLMAHVQQLEAALTALRAERDRWHSRYNEAAAQSSHVLSELNKAEVELAEARARLAVPQSDLVAEAADLLRRAPIAEGSPWVAEAVAWLQKDGVPGTTSVPFVGGLAVPQPQKVQENKDDPSRVDGQ